MYLQSWALFSILGMQKQCKGSPSQELVWGETQQDAPAELSTDTELVRSARLTSSTAAGVCLCGEWGGDPGMAGGVRLGWTGPAASTGHRNSPCCWPGLSQGSVGNRARPQPRQGLEKRSLSLGVMQIGLLN